MNNKIIVFLEDSIMATEVAETFEEEAQFVETAPQPVVSAELPDIKLFGRWSCDEVQVSDMSLQVCSLVPLDLVQCA